MANKFFCSACSLHICLDEIYAHVEEWHVGPKPRHGFYEISCGSCDYTVSDQSENKMIVHCLKMKHSAAGLTLDWGHFIQKESDRISRAMSIAVDLLTEESIEKRKPESEDNMSSSFEMDTNLSDYELGPVTSPSQEIDVNQKLETILHPTAYSSDEICSRSMELEPNSGEAENHDYKTTGPIVDIPERGCNNVSRNTREYRSDPDDDTVRIKDTPSYFSRQNEEKNSEEPRNTKDVVQYPLPPTARNSDGTCSIECMQCHKTFRGKGQYYLTRNLIPHGVTPTQIH